MHKTLVGTIAFCGLATVAGLFASQRSAPIDEFNGPAPATAAVAAPILAGPAREFLPESDTTGLLQESLTVDDLLDEINADFGDKFTPVDRERMAIELRQALGD